MDRLHRGHQIEGAGSAGIIWMQQLQVFNAMSQVGKLFGGLIVPQCAESPQHFVGRLVSDGMHAGRQPNLRRTNGELGQPLLVDQQHPAILRLARICG